MLPRDPQELYQQRVCLGPFVWAQSVDADVAANLWLCDAPFRVERCTIISVAGLAEDAANFADFQVLKSAGSVVVANWSTDSAGAAPDDSVPVDTHLELTMTATDVDRVFAAGDVMQLLISETGTTTIPAGEVIVQGVYV